jgi:hypothetical protein
MHAHAQNGAWEPLCILMAYLSERWWFAYVRMASNTPSGLEKSILWPQIKIIPMRLNHTCLLILMCIKRANCKPGLHNTIDTCLHRVHFLTNKDGLIARFPILPFLTMLPWMLIPFYPYSLLITRHCPVYRVISHEFSFVLSFSL